MKKYISRSILACGMAASLGLTGCIEETLPTALATPSQIAQSSSAVESLLNSLPAFLVTWDTYGSAGNTQDWGYPCQMYMREVCGEDFPVYDSSYSYWWYLENAGSLKYIFYYPFSYYYHFIKNANNIIGTVDETAESTTTAQKQALGVALGFRALCYLDLFREFEYKKTGYAEVDDEAASTNIYGLTVPIVTELTTGKDAVDNPRAPFYTMYRFILTDLNKAEKYLADYEAPSKAYVTLPVIYGLKARLFLDMASRFEQDASALSQQTGAENSDDGYDNVGISSANDCYAMAEKYADMAINSGFTPMTQEEWTNPTTAFNTITNSWMMATIANTIEQVNTTYYWNNFYCQMTSEPSWGMARYGNAFRMISSALYEKIPTSDWRHYSWLNPADAGSTTIPSGYQTLLKGADWASLPAYVNLKFRAGGGNIDDCDKGLMGSLPIMRVEEMYFTKFECMAHTQNFGAAATALTNFINQYRYTDGTYKCAVKDMDEFIQELMVQRRIEFWGEGINYFDYKRLRLPVTRAYSNTNYISAARLNSKDGFVAPWMNFVVPEFECDMNPACITNPNPSGVVKAQ